MTGQIRYRVTWFTPDEKLHEENVGASGGFAWAYTEQAALDFAITRFEAGFNTFITRQTEIETFRLTHTQQAQAVES
jgi:hypothetical protein